MADYDIFTAAFYDSETGNLIAGPGEPGESINLSTQDTDDGYWNVGDGGADYETARYQGYYEANGHLFLIFEFPDDSPDEFPVPGIKFIFSPTAPGDDPGYPASFLDIPTLNTEPLPVCFAAGSLIATLRGEVAVETLSIGDPILTADGRVVPVKWIGRQTLHKFFMGERYSPVRVKAGALGNGLPHSDLTLTADHALMLDGLAINAGALVNGETIIFVPMSELQDQSTYYHIETEDHDAILANGAAAETFVDYVGRKAFDNYQEYLDLYGAERIIPEMHRPRISTHRLVPQAIRDRLGIAEAGFDLPERLSA